MNDTKFSAFVRNKMQQQHTQTITDRPITSWQDAVFKTPEDKATKYISGGNTPLKKIEESERSPKSVISR
ncbi:MAG: hypothetical protein PQ612_05560 [Rickettsiales bacterium]|nr:hypothetical protein [Pseudomonadota bacterium]MDA0966486.1 hypothetical protein [Pseudomonadota bacterium]MDG4543348.1 hypothetical protein [Rickettsiales bacterium]MDG4545614.1 hypothetical protein [Rickettsiales bacterium]MDG4548063.1 hypothetical protein [Rickettsiales bacterium]